MFATVTLSPALDYAVSVAEFSVGKVNRAERASIRYGGKGINVAAVLKNLGQDCVAYGFCAGFTGGELKRLVAEAGICSDFIETPGMTRVNVKIDAGSETEINTLAPEVSQREIDLLTEKLDRLQRGDTLILSGSAPRGAGDTAYAEWMKRYAGKGIRVAVDAAGNLLKNCIPLQPFLIKPNLYELMELTGSKFADVSEISDAAQELRAAGAENVVVSLGKDGALMAASDGKVYRAKAPEGHAVNTVGAGDSLVAGFLAGFLKSGSLLASLRYGVAAGSATALSGELATKERTEEMLNRMEQ